jgi:hypothetical protein
MTATRTAPKYTGVKLAISSEHKLQQFCRSIGVPPNWLLKCHHMTIELKPIAESMVAGRENEYVDLLATHFGFLRGLEGQGICAVKVVTDVPSKNELKHITLAHHAGVKPKTSNEIVDWEDIPVPIHLSGQIAEMP